MHDIMVDEKIKNSKTLTPEEEKEIFIRLNNGEDVRDEIVLRNQGLVRSIAVRYAAYGELEDLIQDGFLGLFKAIDGFDYKRGNKFSTYATWWIKQSIMRAIADKGRTIRIPVHTNEQILKYKRTKQDLTTKLGYEPSVSDISKVMGVSESQINDLERFNMDTVSLNAPVNDDSDDSTLEMFFGVDDSSAIDEEINNQDLKTGIKLALNTLTDKERAIIIKRFGLETGTPRTLEDVGNEYHVTRERIRQIEDKALRKLRKPSVAAYTRAFLDGNDNENAKIHINEITNIFNILKVKNSNSFNLFIQMLNRDELIALNKTFNANHIPKRCSRLTPGENQCLLNVIALFNQLKNFLNNDLYLELLGFLSTNQNKVNLYNYLNFNDKYVLETVLNDLPINYRKDVVRFFNLNTGELRTSIYRYDFIKVVGAVSEINYAFAQRKLPKEIYDKADPKHYSIYDILKTDDKNVIINAINKLDVADQPIIYKFFGLYFNTKITEQTYLDNFSLFNRLRLFLDIKGDDGNGKCL
jgi:RNA polymerase sigma factor (sigma-70 family)